MKKLVFALSLLTLSVGCFAQSLDKITRNCPRPNQNTYAKILVQGNGDIVHTPCVGRSSVFTGNVDFSGATITGTLTGSGTANFIPRFTSASVLGNTPFSWNGTAYAFNNTALNSGWTLDFTPDTAAGVFQVGNFGGAGSNYFRMTQAGGITSFVAATQIDGLAPLVTFGQGAGFVQVDSSGTGTIGDKDGNANGTYFEVSNASQTFTFQDAANAAVFNVTSVANYNFYRTITAGGTTGNQVINRPVGTVNFAAGASDIVVTNNLATANSVILCTVQSLDATAVSCRVTDKAAGSFHIRVPAATAETSVAFFVMN